MIIRLKKDINNLKIGLFGTRKSILAAELDERNINYVDVDHIASIDNSFDIIFSSGVYSIIKSEYLKLPVYGVIGFHETPLPEGRGNAPIQWTIENKRINLTITAFKFVKKMDADYFCKYGSYQFLNVNEIDNYKEPFTVDYAGMGWMLIKKGVFEKIPYPWFAGRYMQLSDTICDLTSEDVSFCLAAKDAGFKVWVDPDIRVGHEKKYVI